MEPLILKQKKFYTAGVSSNYIQTHAKIDILRNEYSVLKYFEEKYRYNTCPNAAILTLQ